MIGRLGCARWAARLVIRSWIVRDRTGRFVRRLRIGGGSASALAGHATVLTLGLLMAAPIIVARHPHIEAMADVAHAPAVHAGVGAARLRVAFERTTSSQAEEGPTGSVEWVPAPVTAPAALRPATAAVTPMVSVGGLAFAPPPGSGGVGVQAIYEVFGNSPGLAWALRVARCESHYNPLAVNASSGASGLFQFMPSTWAAHFKGWNIWDPYAQARAALDFYNRGATNAWTCK
jgi:soluble lytic murein transglycosylase-like protein